MSRAYNPLRNGRKYVLSWPAPGEKLLEMWTINGTHRSGGWNRDVFFRSLQKAVFASYKEIIVCEMALEDPMFELWVKESQAMENFRPLLWTVQVSCEETLVRHRSQIESLNLQIQRWVHGDWPDWDFLRTVRQSRPVELVIFGVKTNSCFQSFEKIPQDFYEGLQFYFPHSLPRQIRWTPKEIISLRAWLLKTFPQITVRPVEGVDVFEPRISERAELEPCHPPLWRSHEKLQPKISVVIPVYNSGFYILNTLRHLEQQTMNLSDYEIVIVDDGSSDRISQDLVELVRDFQMPISLLYYPRLRPRQMGDSQFRAGLARNYGVKWARGDYVVFLDSDILTPPHFLATTLERHRHSSVVQWRREYLRKSVPCASIHHSEIKPQQHCFIPEGGYWHQFYEAAEKQGWPQLAEGWKYACTYAFSLKRDVFITAGWFRKTFCFYGLEDTDLGWRLWQQGETFHLEPTPVFHLYHETVRSEFYNSTFRRQKLLKATSEIFFYNNLSPEIYRVFQYLFNSWFL